MSSIKLKHSGGNSVSISAPSSNPTADRTVTLPSIDADGVITTKDSNDSLQSVSAINGAALSNRNVIINGAMHVNQRSTHGTAVTATGDAQFLTCDRFHWRSYGGSGRASFTQVIGDYPNSEHRFSLKATVTTVNSVEDQYDQAIGYRVEGYDWQRFGWGRTNPKSATISFWVKTSVAGVYSVSMRSGDGTRSQVQETPSLVANTWTKVKLTFAGDDNTTWVGSDRATNGLGCIIEWNLGKSTAKNTGTMGSWISSNKVASNNQVRWIATSGATFFLTGVQVEVGDTATEFEHIPRAETQTKCMRYYQKAGQVHYGMTESSTMIRLQAPFKVEMRTLPSVSVRSGGRCNTRLGGDTTIVNPTLNAATTQALSCWTGVETSGKSSGTPIYGRSQHGDDGDFLQLVCEL